MICPLKELYKETIRKASTAWRCVGDPSQSTDKPEKGFVRQEVRLAGLEIGSAPASFFADWRLPSCLAAWLRLASGQCGEPLPPLPRSGCPLSTLVIYCPARAAQPHLNKRPEGPARPCPALAAPTSNITLFNATTYFRTDGVISFFLWH